MGGFRKFLLRGNVIDLAVAVVVGVAFNAVVQSLVKDLITPLIGDIGGTPNFAGLAFHGFAYGRFINAVVSFLIISAVVYYLIVVPANRLTVLAQRHKVSTERPCPQCLSDIPVAASRCKFCTATVGPATQPVPVVPPAPRRARHGQNSQDEPRMGGSPA